MTKKIFLFAGERSGDLLGGQLIAALRKRLPQSEYVGVGGEKMCDQGMASLFRIEDFETMGLTDLLLSFPKTVRRFRQVLKTILRINPDLVVLIDYPGFNLRLASALRKKGYLGKIIQYVCPTVWAWGAYRIEQMEKSLDLLLTIYPFERELFSCSKLPVTYIGNPLQEAVATHHYDGNWSRLFGIPKGPLIAIFPGSRRSEIANNLPYQIATAKKLKKRYPSLIFAISCAHETIMQTVVPIASQYDLQINKDLFLIPHTYTYELMRDCQTAIAKSGSVTLELALHQKPTVVLYKISRLNRFLAKRLLRIKIRRFCIVNILGEQDIFPELIARGLTVGNLYKLLEKLHFDQDARNRCTVGCQKVIQTVGKMETNKMAAEAIATLIEKR